MTLDPRNLIKEAKNHHIELDQEEESVICQAFFFAQKAHNNQLRKSGEKYITHVYETAMNCVRLGMNGIIIIASLLHDVIEDSDTTKDELKAEFGEEVANLVEGVTKLGKVKYQGNARHVESLRKFFISVAKDVRVVIIKLADRLHNLYELEYIHPEKQKRIAIESIEIYSQLASRLGMGKLASEIQDAAFPYSYPEDYKRTNDILEKEIRHTTDTLDRVHRGIIKELGSSHIRDIKIKKRIKSKYSLYRKLVKRDWNISEIYDIIALRIITDSPEMCYRILGLIHAHYKPVPGRIKDFIALPKPNGYKSLHTTIFTGDGNSAEIQIRTKEMEYINEYGISSHHMYKKSSNNEKYERESFNWLSDLSQLDSGGSKKNYSNFLKTLRTDFFHDRIFVYSPRGDVIDLPDGATALDFAYAIHSDIGNHAYGGIINGKYSALKTKLNNYDVVEIVVDKRSRPTPKWQYWCVTNLAKRQISSQLSKNNKKENY